MKLDGVPGKGGGATAMIRVEPQKDGSFIVNGGEALNATIKPVAEGGWIFDGTIKFPAHGYTVDKPFVTNMDTMVGNKLQGSTGMTTFTLPFKYPKQMPPTKEPESFPVNLKFDAPAKTQFVVMLMPTL